MAIAPFAAPSKSIGPSDHGIVKVYHAAALTVKAELSASPPMLAYSFTVFNTTAAAAYLQVFDLASASVTLGTTTPRFALGIPASGSIFVEFEKPMLFTVGFVVAGTTTATGATGAALNVVIAYMDVP